MLDISDLRPTVVPKSDQLNSEQLLSGPITITVNEVRVGSSDEQPISIYYENDNGRPYKPCKTMRKVLIYAWGVDGRDWCGKSMTLYNDPLVKFGGAEVGGIRISHMSHIKGTINIALTATKGRKVAHQIHLIEVDEAPTLQSVLSVIARVKGQRGKSSVEALIAELPECDQAAASAALAERIKAISAAA